jgi:hypothetical protein
MQTKMAVVSKALKRLSVALIGVTCAAVLLGSADGLAATFNLLISPTGSTNDFTGSIGYRFAGASNPTTSTARGLGFVDSGTDGLSTSHQVGLYHLVSGTYDLLQSVTIGAGSAYYLNQGYRWYPIPDLVLSDTNANAYFLAATVTNGDGDLWGGVGSATFTSVGNNTLNAGYNSTAGSQSSSLLPATWSGTFPGDTFYNAPNLTTAVVPVPEPSTLAIGAAGLGIGVWRVVQRRKRA